MATSVVASVAYGVIHDQITARLFLPYFTKWPVHVRMLRKDSDDPTYVGLIWGVFATWWVGLILGVLLAFACTFGEGRWWTWRQIRIHLLAVLIATGFFAALGWFTSRSLGWQVDAAFAGAAVDPQRPDDLVRFTAVLVAHNVAYLVGAAGGLAVVLVVFIQRRRMMMLS